MKKLLVVSMLFTVNAFAGSGANLRCVADRLQAVNSSIFYDLSDSDVESMLTIPEMMGHDVATEMAKRCEMSNFSGQPTAKGYECIASKLGIDANESQIDSMLTIVEYAGHREALEAARACKVY